MAIKRGFTGGANGEFQVDKPKEVKPETRLNSVAQELMAAIEAIGFIPGEDKRFAAQIKEITNLVAQSPHLATEAIVRIKSLTNKVSSPSSEMQSFKDPRVLDAELTAMLEGLDRSK